MRHLLGWAHRPELWFCVAMTEQLFGVEQKWAVSDSEFPRVRHCEPICLRSLHREGNSMEALHYSTPGFETDMGRTYSIWNFSLYETEWIVLSWTKLTTIFYNRPLPSLAAYSQPSLQRFYSCWEFHCSLITRPWDYNIGHLVWNPVYLTWGSHSLYIGQLGEKAVFVHTHSYIGIRYVNISPPYLRMTLKWYLFYHVCIHNASSIFVMWRRFTSWTCNNEIGVCFFDRWPSRNNNRCIRILATEVFGQIFCREHAKTQ